MHFTEVILKNDIKFHVNWKIAVLSTTVLPNNQDLVKLNVYNTSTSVLRYKIKYFLRFK